MILVADFVHEIRKHYGGLIVPKKVPASYWGKIHNILNEVRFTLEDAKILGPWLARQKKWLPSVTLIVLANKAGEWLAKAQAEAKKPTQQKKDIEWADLSDLEE